MVEKYSKQEFKDICYFMASILDQVDQDHDDKEFSGALNVAVETLEDIEKNLVI